jgi:hypothetical protein
MTREAFIEKNKHLLNKSQLIIEGASIELLSPINI